MPQSKIDKQIEETTGSIIINMFFGTLGFIRTCYNGFSSWNNNMKIRKYAVKNILLLITLFIAGTITINMTKTSIIIFIAFIINIYRIGKKYTKMIANIEADKEAKKEQLNNRFMAVGFKDRLNMTPELIQRKSMNEYFENIMFLSNIPLDDWKKNKSKIEEIMNTRIIKIETDLNNTSIKICNCSKMAVPTYVKFDRKYLSSNPYEIFVGLDIYGQATYMNLYRSPHAIISGGTNTGKSTNAFSFFTQLKQHKCNKIILCDFKQVTFKSLVKYNNNKKAINNKSDFIDMMKWSITENKRRIQLFNEFDDCENITEYNKLVEESKQLKNIFIFIDELAMIVDEKDKELEDLIKAIAQTGRSQGFYLLVFTQRPSVKTVPAEARANFMSRLSSFQTDKATSEMAVGDFSASQLPDIVGRCILKLGNAVTEVQAVHIKKEDLYKYLLVAN